MTTPNHFQNFTTHILKLALHQRCAELNNYIAEKTKRTVQAGPFKDMLLPEGVSWGQGDIAAKLLGTYEQELHPAIEKAIARKPEMVFNVGSAEGFYAVGLARRLPDVDVAACDTDVKAREVTYEAASINGVSIAHLTDFTSSIFLEYAGFSSRALIVIDVEGAELALLDAATVTQLMAHTDVIVECHDFIDPGITDTLKKRFAATHEIELITETAREPFKIDLLKNINTFDALLALCEFRPCSMQWLVAWSKER
jgi:hypothetical protein